MSNIPFTSVDDWQQARDVYPDQPVILFCFYGANNTNYMRYHSEFHRIDDGSYTYLHLLQQQWSIAGITFNDDIISWMINNSIALPFSPEDLMLYQLTWGDSL